MLNQKPWERKTMSDALRRSFYALVLFTLLSGGFIVANEASATKTRVNGRVVKIEAGTDTGCFAPMIPFLGVLACAATQTFTPVEILTVDKCEVGGPCDSKQRFMRVMLPADSVSEQYKADVRTGLATLPLTRTKTLVDTSFVAGTPPR